MLTKSTTLTEQVASQLVAEIAAGVHPVGGKLPTGKALAQRYGVSAAVIREATERLRAQGLVASRQGAGCTVIARTASGGFQVPGRSLLTRQQLADVFELRMELEGSAAALAALRRDAADLAEMQRCLTLLEQHLHHPELAVEHDIAFHAAIAVATHNAYYQQLLQYLNLQVRAAVRMARENTLQHPSASVDEVHQEHVAVHQAIVAGDAALARQAARRHLRRAAARLALNLSEVDGASGHSTEATSLSTGQTP
ncbi:FadR/GntR family transcriptional regulator [Bordetella sp. 02P26C-1]|uniref:FadR/GntR family transcriptional regulator n=1 Tax=Bordetella sp. 02P26C-1 TaxID=2683195 RepID=UPI00135290A2|nr:FCD domain-containing protein [Bordetella sp. 02P26C-1]MVW79325.1 FCD domain-containing protein [Bordetella sp. 02P26C-1]